jgi:hypothetical protein
MATPPDVLADPLQLVFELIGGERRGAEHPKPPAFVTSTTRSRQWLKAKRGDHDGQLGHQGEGTPRTMSTNGSPVVSSIWERTGHPLRLDLPDSFSIRCLET